MSAPLIEGIGTRREARERALSILYEAELKDSPPEVILATLPISSDDFASELVTGVGQNIAELDETIARFAKDWKLDRMPVIDLTLLRIGVYELAYRHDIPLGATISEAVELAKRYSTEDSGRFINGVLARVGEELGRS